MQEKQLHKLGKTDLLTLIYKQEKQIQRLTKEVEELKQQLEDRTIQIKEAGSIAEASLKINKIFEVAQQAADEYLRSIKEVNKPSHECAEINEKASNDKADKEIQNNDCGQEDTYEKNTNEKNTKELILVNNEIILPRTKLLKKVLVLLLYIAKAITTFVILVTQNTVIICKKINLSVKAKSVKLKCKISSIKNCIKENLSNVKCKIVIAIRICKRITIQNFQKGKIKSKRAFKKLNCNIEKAKRFLSKKSKTTCILIGKATKFVLKRILFAILKLFAKTKQFIKRTINKCKVRLIVRRFKIRNKRAYKIKLIEATKETKIEKADNLLIFVNNGMILYKTSILSYIIKYLKIVKAVIIVVYSKTKAVVSKILKKAIKILKTIAKITFRVAKKIFICTIKRPYKYLSKKINILKIRLKNKIRHTKRINEINEHIHIEETKNALILVNTQLKPFKQKTLIRLLISLKKLKIKIKVLSLKIAKKALIIENIIIRKVIIVIKKVKRKIIKKCGQIISFIKNTKKKRNEKRVERKNIKQMSKETHKAIIKNLQISMPDLERELKRRKEKNIKLAFIKTLGFSAMVIVAFAIITSTSFFKILQVSGTSMQPTLYEGELLITSKFFKYEKGDMVAFYYNDSVLIKRVIATENDIVNIEYDGTVYVNSKKLEERYVKKLALGNCDITFPYQVPKNSVFILGDNREDSIDSRSKALGSISKDRIIGKIQIRLNPFVIY